MRALLPLAAIVFVAATVQADHGVGRCYGGNNSDLGPIEFGWGDPRATLYLDDRGAIMGNGIWLYQESNGVFGERSIHDRFQHGGSSIGGLHDETCTDVGDYAPDTLIY